MNHLTKRIGILPIFLAANMGHAELFLHTNHKCVSPVERREIHIYFNSEEVTLESAPQERSPEAACKMDYVKSGLTETLWTAAQDPYYCKAKARELIESLEETGFKCVSTSESARQRTHVEADLETPKPETKASLLDVPISEIDAQTIARGISEEGPGEKIE